MNGVRLLQWLSTGNDCYGVLGKRMDWPVERAQRFVIASTRRRAEHCGGGRLIGHTGAVEARHGAVT